VLSLTKKVGYGLIALTHLSRQPQGQLASARSIAEQFGVPVSLLMNILKELSAAGYVDSVRGARGGYKLSRSPEDITLADLIGTLEGPIRVAECVQAPSSSPAKGSCPLTTGCPIMKPIQEVQDRLYGVMSELTLADIARNGGRAQPAEEALTS
jgi:Rrf2 family protein